ncbi:MAG: efflux RND transporter permease subunit [Phycisphaerae bacterium]|nr:efflux RND transporter permease subunit [Phycisphaerae bacterium]
MSIAKYSLKHRVIIVVLTIIMVMFGIKSYQNLGRLSYPDFTIKTALITTAYPGGSPAEVAEEVTDVIEEAVQQLGQLDYVTSTTQDGLSVVTVEIKDTYKSHQIPQIWDELRRKINDAQSQLPPGAGPSTVHDDFGDVYGVFFAITGDDYSYAQLKDFAESLKKDLLQVNDVAKINYWGTRTEVIYVEFNRAKMALLGLSPQQIAQAINMQNMVEPSGKIKVGPEYIRFSPSGELAGEEAIANIYIAKGNDGLVQLRDVATVSRGYIDPPRNMMYFNGKRAIGFGISTEKGANVVDMSDAILNRIEELKPSFPAGIKLDIVNLQGADVTDSLNNFLINLAESIAIVVVLLLLFMGLKSGLLIGGILLLTIIGTFIGMDIMGIDLHLLSLGALVLALGMLVDNAIVVTDSYLIKIQRGTERKQAATEAVNETIWPLFGATVVAVFAFVPIGFNPSSAGEFCKSLFFVLAISLMLSWVLAITVTPMLCASTLARAKKAKDDPFDTKTYHFYRRFLHRCIRFRWLTLLLMFLLLITAMYGFTKIPNSFFPASTRSQFIVDYWRSQGDHIDQTSDDLAQIQGFLSENEHVKNVTTFVGEGALRFVLTYNYHSPNTSYGQLIVEVDDYHEIPALKAATEKFMLKQFPDAEPKISLFQEGPPMEFTVEARFRGPDTVVLRELARKAKEILYADGKVIDIRDNWRQKAKVFRPQYSFEQGSRAGISRLDLSKTLQWSFNGLAVGLYRENDELLPIISRPPAEERGSIADFENIQIWSNPLGRFLPIGQVVQNLEITQEDAIINRRDRMPTITVQCNPAEGVASKLVERIKDKIEAIEIPSGYSMEWGGEHEESVKSQAPIQKLFPVCLLGMFITVVFMFNTLRDPIIIFLCIPLAIIGVAAALLPLGISFGFMAILGFLGLTGMLVKNSIVLIEQVKLDLADGKAPYQAVMDSSVSRLRPVTMAAGTTILGMGPLLWHPFFQGMAATIMGGLMAATALTLVVVPLLYTLFYRIKPDIALVDLPKAKAKE